MVQKFLDFLKVNYKVIFLGIIGLFVLYYLIFLITPNVKMSSEQTKKIDSLNMVIKKMNEDNLRLEKKITDFNIEIQDINNNINNIKGQKTIVKEYYHEKINSVDKLTIRELDSFFSNRYKY